MTDIPDDLRQTATRIADKYLGFTISCQGLYDDIATALHQVRQKAIEEERERDVGLGLLLELYRRHRVAHLKGEPTRVRLFDMIGDFEWAFPEIKQRCDEIYPPDRAIRT